MPIYCVDIRRDFAEDNLIEHMEFENEPSREDVLNRILEMDINYDDNYHKFSFFKVK